MDEPKQIEKASGGDKLPSWREVFLYFLFLGFVNIGGPVAQITMMFNHMVEKRRWLSKDRFIKIMAFCHMLPGPEALQLAIYVGYLKRRVWGGILAGLTFILPDRKSTRLNSSHLGISYAVFCLKKKKKKYLIKLLSYHHYLIKYNVTSIAL